MLNKGPHDHMENSFSTVKESLSASEKSVKVRERKMGKEELVLVVGVYLSH